MCCGFPPPSPRWPPRFGGIDFSDLVFGGAPGGDDGHVDVLAKRKILISVQKMKKKKGVGNVSNGMYDLKGCIVFNDGKSVMYSWENTTKCSVNLHNSYLPAGAMVPAYGRLTLLSGLEIVGENLAMCDTDSTVYKSSLDSNT